METTRKLRTTFDIVNTMRYYLIRMNNLAQSAPEEDAKELRLLGLSSETLGLID